MMDDSLMLIARIERLKNRTADPSPPMDSYVNIQQFHSTWKNLIQRSSKAELVRSLLHSIYGSTLG